MLIYLFGIQWNEKSKGIQIDLLNSGQNAPDTHMGCIRVMKNELRNTGRKIGLIFKHFWLSQDSVEFRHSKLTYTIDLIYYGLEWPFQSRRLKTNGDTLNPQADFQ